MRQQFCWLVLTSGTVHRPFARNSCSRHVWTLSHTRPKACQCALNLRQCCSTRALVNVSAGPDVVAWRASAGCRVAAAPSREQALPCKRSVTVSSSGEPAPSCFLLSCFWLRYLFLRHQVTIVPVSFDHLLLILSCVIFTEL